MSCHIILSGGFCTGKTTLINMLQQEMGIKKLSAHTTRGKRPGEEEGNPYTFLTREQFEENFRLGLYFDRIDHKNGHSYAVLKKEMHGETKWLLDILSSSWKTYSQAVPDAIGIYLETPPVEELRRRAKLRKDKEEEIEIRIKALENEDPSDFHYRIPPQKNVEDSYQIIKEIILGQFFEIRT